MAALCVSACAFALVASGPVSAGQTAEEILGQAELYTVKITALNSIGLNQDSGGTAGGAGFLIDKARGWILTNAHVATRSPVVLKVAFKDEKELPGKRLHVDPLLDVAIIQVDPKSLPTTAVAAELECSGLPAVGTPIAAFGHPWGLSFTATRGIVSGVPWLFPGEYVQTDAILNHGNSGGPLINLNTGKVVGLNARLYNPETDNKKFSSAISLSEPIPAICRIVELLKAGEDTRLKLLPMALATAGDNPRPRIARTLDASSPFLPGDLIVGINGSSGVRNASDLATRLRGPASSASVTIERTGKTMTLSTPLLVQPDPLAARDINVSGLIIGKPWRLDEFEINPAGSLIVDFIEPGSLAEATEASSWSYVHSVDGRSFTDVDKLYAYLSSKAEDAMIQFIISGYSDASEFIRIYHYFELPRGELKMVTVQ